MHDSHTKSNKLGDYFVAHLICCQELGQGNIASNESTQVRNFKNVEESSCFPVNI